MSSSINVAEITAHKRLDGVEFQIKSDPLEKFFRALSGGQTIAVGRSTPRPRPPRDEDAPQPRAHPEPVADVSYTGATRRYQLELVENGIPRLLTGFSHGRFDLWGCAELIHSRGPKFNLALLTAVGSGDKDGVSVTIPTVISDKMLTEYTEGLKASIRQLYIDYIGDRTHHIIITSEHVIS